MSNYRLETSVLNTDFYLKSLNELSSAGTLKEQKSKNIDDSFYSVMIKHQLEMARAWNPSGENLGFNLNPLSFSKTKESLAKTTRKREQGSPTVLQTHKVSTGNECEKGRLVRKRLGGVTTRGCRLLGY